MEYLHQPELYVPEVLARVKPEYMRKRYGLPDFDPACHPLSGEEEMTKNKKGATDTSEVAVVEYGEDAKWPIDADLFLELVSKKTGKLLKVRTKSRGY